MVGIFCCCKTYLQTHQLGRGIWGSSTFPPDFFQPLSHSFILLRLKPDKLLALERPDAWEGDPSTDSSWHQWKVAGSPAGGCYCAAHARMALAGNQLSLGRAGCASLRIKPILWTGEPKEQRLFRRGDSEILRWHKVPGSWWAQKSNRKLWSTLMFPGIGTLTSFLLIGGSSEQPAIRIPPLPWRVVGGVCKVTDTRCTQANWAKNCSEDLPLKCFSPATCFLWQFEMWNLILQACVSGFPRLHPLQLPPSTHTSFPLLSSCTLQISCQVAQPQHKQNKCLCWTTILAKDEDSLPWGARREVRFSKSAPGELLHLHWLQRRLAR